MGSDALTLLLDTHVLVWSLKDDEQLGAKARQRIERESARGGVARLLELGAGLKTLAANR